MLSVRERLSLLSRGTIRVIGLAALALAIWKARRVLLLGFFSVLLAVALSFPVAWLERRVSRGIAVLIVLALLVLGLTGIGALAAPPLAAEVQSVAESAPRGLQHARDWWDHLTRAPGEVARDGPSSPAPPTLATRAAEAALPAALGAALVVTEAVLVLVMALFLVYQPRVYLRGLRLMVPQARLAVFDELVTRLTTGLRRWVGGILVSMLIMGALTAGALLAVGVESWALLGVLTFLGTFVPYLGAVASAVPGLLVALGQSPRHFVLALAVYAMVHVVEGYVVEPVVMRRAVQVEPALLLAGQAILGSVFGMVGVVVATPLVVCARIAVEYLWVQRRARAPAAHVGEGEAAAP